MGTFKVSIQLQCKVWMICIFCQWELLAWRLQEQSIEQQLLHLCLAGNREMHSLRGEMFPQSRLIFGSINSIGISRHTTQKVKFGMEAYKHTSEKQEFVGQVL